MDKVTQRERERERERESYSYRLTPFLVVLNWHELSKSFSKLIKVFSR